MLGHGEVAPRPRTCCGQSRGRESRSSWFLAQGFPSPSSPSGTFGMGRVFSLFHQLNNSLSAVSSRGESQGSQPPIPSLSASGSSFWDLSEMAGGDPALSPCAGTSSSCSAGNAQFRPRASPAALPGQPEQRSGISFSRDNGNLYRVCRTSEEAGVKWRLHSAPPGPSQTPSDPDPASGRGRQLSPTAHCLFLL